jgi:hypothetical protein
MSVSLPFRWFLRTGSLIVLLALAAGCGGLSAEPKTVTTLIPPTTAPTVQPPTATAPVAASPAASSPTAAASSTLGVTGTEEAPGTTGIVTGHVANGTAGGTVPPGIKVTLHIVDDSGDVTLDRTVDANGDFTFADVPIKAGATYAVSTIYQNRQFISETATGDPNARNMNLPLKLYEVTSDPGVIGITSMVTRVNGTADSIQVAQVIRFRNKSDRVFGSAQPISGQVYGSVTLALPKGAVLMGFADESSRFVLAPDGSAFTDTLPVIPNEDHVVHYIYTLPYRAEGTPIELPIAYPVDGPLQLLLNPPTLSATSQQLISLGTQTMGSTTFQVYSGQVAMNAGDVLRFNISGQPGGSSASGDSPMVSARELLIGALIGMGIAAIAIGLILLIRDYRRKGQPAHPQKVVGVSSKATPNMQNEQVEALIGELARLDEKHEQGKLGKAAYHRQRKLLKARLAELMKE